MGPLCPPPPLSPPPPPPPPPLSHSCYSSVFNRLTPHAISDQELDGYNYYEYIEIASVWVVC